LKTIVLIGQPNVGKSSFFNRLVKHREAITSDIAGTTRDFKKREIEIFEKEALLIDTGGLDDSNEIFQNIKDKSLNQAKNGDIILYMVDGKKTPDDNDIKFFYELQKVNPNIALVINKIDNDREKERVYDFYSFGAKNLFHISVSHNRDIVALKKWISNLLPDTQSIENFPIDEEESLEDFLDNVQIDEDDNFVTKDDRLEEMADLKDIKIAIIGKVNVGKSSLLNAITGTQRSVVSSIAGTTIDPVDETMSYKDYHIQFVDTAGLRRRGKIEGIEKYALNRTTEMLEKANMAIIVLDASCEFADLDEKIAGLTDKFKLGTIVVFNKWDNNLHDFDKTVKEFRRRFRFLYFAPIMAISAQTGRSIDKLKDKIIEVFENSKQRISTSKLNNVIKMAINKHHIPSQKGRPIRIYFATQFDSLPPKIAIIVNKKGGVHFSYKRYLINFLRENFNFEGVPIQIIERKKGERNDNEEEENRLKNMDFNEVVYD
jgi:GTP-binding protein